MKIKREVTMSVDRLEVDDKFKIKIGGKKYAAVAIRQDKDGMLCVLKDCLCRHAMNDTNTTECGYEKSEMRQFLRITGNMISAKWKKRMIPNEAGDLLWLLSTQEVFGMDEKWNDCDGQIEWMKDRRNRIAYIPGEDNSAFWWLRDVVSGTNFALVGHYGLAGYADAGDSHGVRPAFKILNPQSPGECPDVEDMRNEEGEQ